VRSTRITALIALVVAVALCAACGSKKDGGGDPADKDGVAKGSDEPTIDPNAPVELVPGTPAATALGELTKLTLPELDSPGPDCAKYSSSLSSFFSTLAHQTRRLADKAAKGIPPEELVKFSVWLNGRAQVFEQMTLADDELTRVHRELVGTVADLSESFALLVPTKEHPSTAGAGRRIENAVGNFKVTLGRLEKACTE
jgi:hypothetical protein